jgi:hypothetical protein
MAWRRRIARALQRSCSCRSVRCSQTPNTMYEPHVTAFDKSARLKLDRLRLRGPTGACDEFLLAATAQNLRKLAKLITVPSLKPA